MRLPWATYWPHHPNAADLVAASSTRSHRNFLFTLSQLNRRKKRTTTEQIIRQKCLRVFRKAVSEKPKQQKKPFDKTECSLSSQNQTPLTNTSPEAKGCGCFTSLPSPALPSPAPTAERPLPIKVAVQDMEAVQFVEDYHAKHRHYFGASTLGTVPSLSPQQQGQVQTAIDRYGRERLGQLVEVFFGSDTVYIQRHGHSLPVFLSMLHVLPFVRSKPTDD